MIDEPEGFQVLLPETEARAEGRGSGFRLGARRGKLLVITLNIARVVEHGSLLVSIWGSKDGNDWRERPLTIFPPKNYCGVYSVLLNLANSSDIEYLRVCWQTGRWVKRNVQPLFEFSVLLEESGARISIPAPTPRKPGLSRAS